MNIYYKIKKEYDNYRSIAASEARCLHCPSALFLEHYFNRNDIHCMLGCGDFWEYYGKRKFNDDGLWYEENDLDNCINCRAMALKLSKIEVRTIKI